MIKAVLLDVDNTLMDFNACAEQSLVNTFKEYNLKFSEEYHKIFFAENDKLWLELEKGTIDKEYLHKVRFEIIFGKLGIHADAIAFDKSYMHNLSLSNCLIDGAIDLLEYLKKKYVLCIASNGTAYVQKGRLKITGIDRYIEKMFISDNIGFPKPSPKFFDYCMSDLEDISKDEIVMIGDSISADISGAINYGIKTIWFDYYNSHSCGEYKPDYTVTSLSEIKKIL